MKKLTRKLFLSVAALAACCATLVSTTFAWYVSNSNATISETTGMATAGTEVSGNLLVAQASGVGTGTYSLDGGYAASLSSITGKVTPALNPVSKDITGALPSGEGVTATGWHDADLNPVATSAAYGEMAFFVRSSNADLTITYTIKNTTGTTNVKTQTAYASDGLPTGVSIGDKFYKDAIDALRVEVLLLNPDIQADQASYTEDNLVTYKTFAASDFTKAAESLTGAATGGNANNYYEALMGARPADARTEATADVISNDLSVVTGIDQLVVIRYWLEGTDNDCFDSCIAQSFSFAFDLEFRQ